MNAKSTKSANNVSKAATSSFEEFQSQMNDVWDLDDLSGVVVAPDRNNSRVTFVPQSALPCPPPLPPPSATVHSISSYESPTTDAGEAEASDKPPLPTVGPGMGIRLHNCHHSSITSVSTSSVNAQQRLQRFHSLIEDAVTDIQELRRLSWSGIPVEVRHTVWKLLVSYLPPVRNRRESSIRLKRGQYFEFVTKYYVNNEMQEETRIQIHKDIHRMSALTHMPHIQKRFERLISIWALRHPASGYVQGINDLVMPFFVVFLSEYVYVDLNTSQELTLAVDPDCEDLDKVEADSYWCVNFLLDGIHNHYIFAQPGIQHCVDRLAALILRYDTVLHEHIVTHKVLYMQFAFRWMNNLLMRELPLRCIIRLWDTYQSEDQGYSQFHVYVCAALLLRFKRDVMLKNDFQSLMIFLQQLPTCHWTDEEVSELLATAYSLQCYFPHLDQLASPDPRHLI